MLEELAHQRRVLADALECLVHDAFEGFVLPQWRATEHALQVGPHVLVGVELVGVARQVVDTDLPSIRAKEATNDRGAMRWMAVQHYDQGLGVALQEAFEELDEAPRGQRALVAAESHSAARADGGDGVDARLVHLVSATGV